jgi:hypothetical protein
VDPQEIERIFLVGRGIHWEGTHDHVYKGPQSVLTFIGVLLATEGCHLGGKSALHFGSPIKVGRIGGVTESMSGFTRIIERVVQEELAPEMVVV